jgi:hypothetical protein
MATTDGTEKKSKVPVIISAISLFVSIFAFGYSWHSGWTIRTNNEIDKFDAKWVGGTFKCVDYLGGLSDDQKIKAYKGAAHSIATRRISELSSCIPQKSEYLTKLGNSKAASVDIGADAAYEAKESVRKSFNALDILVSRQDQIDRCEMWRSIKEIVERPTTKTLVEEWRRYGDCGTDCFKAVSALISNGEVQVLNRKCN